MGSDEMSRHAANTDPITSHEAAARAEASGLVDSDTDLLARLIRARPGLCIRDMAQQAGVDQIRLARRAGDVRRKNLAHSRGSCIGGLLWWPGPEPTEEAQQAALFEVPAKWSGH